MDFDRFWLISSPKAYEATKKLAGVDEDLLYLMEVREWMERE